MTAKKKLIKTKQIEHPMEEVLEIEPGTTVVEYKELVPVEPVKIAEYDVKDDEIEGKLEEIYTVAMGQVEAVGDELDRVEGKYKARIGEVTANMLNVALGAVREKREMKSHKDKLFVSASALKNKLAGGEKTVNNNLIVADQSEILRVIQGEKKDEDDK